MGNEYLLTCLGAGSCLQKLTNISQQRPTKLALVTAFDSRAKLWIIAENKSLQTNCLSSMLFVEIAKRTMAPQKVVILFVDSTSVHVKASKHKCNSGTAISLFFKRNLQ